MEKNITAAEAFGVDEFKHFSLVVTDNCNLHCPCCSTRGNIPIREDSDILCRQWEYKMPIDDLKKFCKKLDGIGHTDWHRLTGGEPTLYPDLCREIIDVLCDYNRKITLFTNAYQILELEPEYIHEIGWLLVDDHGVNHDDVVALKRYLKEIDYKGKKTFWKIPVHYDLKYAMYHPKNDIYCGHMCRVVMLFNHLVYPCAHHYCTELFHNTTEYSDLLRSTGWDLDDDWVSLLRNWPTSIHGDIWEMCYSCWRPYWKMKKLPRMK